jgi:nucleoside-diphosphate-sugar epimerase
MVSGLPTAMGKVLVTGGSGFIGSHSILQILVARHQVCTTLSPIVASLDRKRLGTKVARKKMSWTRGVFDEEARRKPLAFAADAVSYGI